MHITSLQNPRVKWLLRLQANSRHRRAEQLFTVEGADEIELAYSAGHKPRLIVQAPELTRRPMPSLEGERLTVAPAVFHKLSVRQNPDGWIAVFERPVWTEATVELTIEPLVLVLESIEKPGNLGALLRTADAAAVDAVIVCDPGVDLFSPNVVRASRGALFSIPVIQSATGRSIEFLKARGIRIVAADANEGQPYQEVDLTGPLAIVMGAEDSGLSGDWLTQAASRVNIPMGGKVNSLNVSVAAALIIYEALRQRR